MSRKSICQLCGYDKCTPEGGCAKCAGPMQLFWPEGVEPAKPPHECIHKADPICGHCKEPRSKHFTEPDRDELFCTTYTTGDLFTDEPSDDDILELLEQVHPGMCEKLDMMWKEKFGHTPKVEYIETAEITDALVEKHGRIPCEWKNNHDKWVGGILIAVLTSIRVRLCIR